MLTSSDFHDSLADANPPEGFAPALQALWWAGKGDWDRAHVIAGDRQDDADCNLVHGHLHRAQGDAESAQHWYAQSGRASSDLPLEQEWHAIAADLLSARSAITDRS